MIDGHVADKLIVSARTSGEQNDREGISLFLVDRDTAGVSVERTIMVDSRNAAIVRFDQAQVSAEALLGELDQGFATLEKVLDIANAQLAAELLGISLQAFEITVKYLQERKQFGVPIGTFQAVKHICADLLVQVESAAEMAERRLAL
ncbi:MAG TPA: acyl-CoA dehydrogenase [Planctomycetes bacterium]|nr:acyl-CoA dehydrogenase [Planctomycetota bacterium]